MGNCTEQVGTKGFLTCNLYLLFLLCKNFGLFLQTGSGCGGEQCNDQHSDKCDRIAAQCEIQSEKRIGKEEIDTDYGENRRKEPIQVSIRISCNQDLGNNIKQCDVCSIFRNE